MLSIIVAIASNNVIGKDNKLLWYLPEDLKRFKKLTTNHTIIMGRKTFESIGKVLPDRKHVVLTHNLDYVVDDPNVEIVHSIEDIQKYIDDDEENFVIGGALIYRMLLDKCKRMYITKINRDFEGDAVFPKINEEEWTVSGESEIITDENLGFDYKYINYERK